MIKKILSIIIFFILVLVGYLFIGKSKPAEKVEWGVTFSEKYAKDLSLDWQKTYTEILDDLKVKKIRLIAYWDDIEKEQEKYDFTDLDWQINEASKRGAEIILVVGRRLPRWPECFEAGYAKNFSEQEKQDRILVYIQETINHYKDNQNIKIWQIENEPFLRTYGDCPKLDKSFLDKEIKLAEFLDATRPIMVTESGEFSTWIGGARRADVIGSSIYRKIHGKLGYVQYPIPPVYYQRKANLIKTLFDIKEIIAIEVQAEPWGDKPTQQMTNEEQDITMSLERFNDVLKYTQDAGFNKAYLWGVEWWYWRKVNGDDRFWNRAKELF